MPELGKVSAALDEERFAEAARLLGAVMAEHPPEGRDVVGWQFMLARLREQAELVDAAIASYELAGREQWPLRDYALLGTARVELRRGRADRALTALGQIKKEGAIADAARLLEAEAATVENQLDLAIANWQAHLAGDAPEDAGLVALRLSQALLKRQLAANPPATTVPAPATAALAPVAAVAAPSALASTVADPRSGSAVPADLLSALAYARRAQSEFVRDPKSRAAADRSVEQVLSAMAPAARQRYLTPKLEEELYRLTVLVEARQEKLAIEVADTLLKNLPESQKFGSIGCEARLGRAKALAIAEEYGNAADSLGDAVQRCKGDPDLRARLLFLAGKYARFDGRHMQAVQRFEQLEREVPEHRLADDARVYAAQSYFKLGVEARFTELLSKLPRDYPRGDMVMDGVFELALRRIDKGDWSGAASVLELGKTLTIDHDRARGQEYSGRERYFLARAWQEMKHEAEALDEYESIVTELPLSYYMLHAYSRLKKADPARAAAAVTRAKQLSETEPFSFESRPEFTSDAFVRGMELLRLGEVDLAKRELNALGSWNDGANSKLLWAVALLYARAGAVKLSHSMTRGLLTDWLGRWPSGDWSDAWQIAFPRPYLGIVQREAKHNGLPEAWVYGVMREESAFDPRAVSHANAYGLMQLIVPTAKLYARPLGLPYDARSLQRPEINIALGTRALSTLTQRFRENPLLALPAYNAGPGRPRRWVNERPYFDFDVWVELIPIRETYRYTKRVLASRAAYAVLYEPEFSEQAMTLPLKVAN